MKCSFTFHVRYIPLSSNKYHNYRTPLYIIISLLISESTVRTAIKELEENGWLSREKRRKGNRNASNIYQLNVEKLFLAARAACH